MDVYYKLKCYR